MMSTYKEIKPCKMTGQILVFLSEQRDPVSGMEVSRALGFKYGTVMCYLATLEDMRFARRVGEYYELGQAAAMLWARKKTKIETRIETNQRELAELEG
jgi:DNA-binding IclR family transcriptional regulator